MKKTLIKFFVIFSISTLPVSCEQKTKTESPEVSKAPEFPKVVCARYSNSWYEAQALSETNGKIQVKYYDGIEADLVQEDVKNILTKEELQVNDRVLAVWKSGVYYEGSVSEIKPNGAMIVWDDGSIPSLVTYSKIAKGFPKSNKPKYSELSGEEVCIETNGSFVQAKIMSSGNGITHVMTYSNTEIDTPTNTLIKPLKKLKEIKKGDEVMAIWAASIFYQGKVSSIEKDGIIVEWKDGSKPSFVGLGKFFKK